MRGWREGEKGTARGTGVGQLNTPLLSPLPRWGEPGTTLLSPDREVTTTGKVTATVPRAGSLWEPVSGPELRAAACTGHHQPKPNCLAPDQSPKTAFLRPKQRCTEWWQAPGQGGTLRQKKQRGTQ